MSGRSRRALLVVGTGLAGLAGCVRPDSADAGTPSAGEPSSPRSEPSSSPSEPTNDGGARTTAPQTASPVSDGTEPSSTDELDLREANVVDVAVADEGGGRYRFEVTLHHDDAGEDGYANWWQVETVDWKRLGRRELLHPHSQQPFTRSETVAVPGDVDCVVVRSHDQSTGTAGKRW